MRLRGGVASACDLRRLGNHGRADRAAVACRFMNAHTSVVARSLGLGALSAMVPHNALAHGAGVPQPTPLSALTSWSIDPLPWATALVAAAGYLLLVRRVNGAHPRTRVPRWRVALWLAGLATILVALVSAVDVYADSLLTVHMIQHLLLAMVAPPLLALGAPVTLLLRAASPSLRGRLILPVLHASVVRVLASPVFAWPAFAVVMVLVHFSALYEAALEDSTLHIAEHVLFLAAGMLFWWPVVAADPIHRRMSYGARLVYVVLQMPLNAAVGLAIYFAPTVLYAHYVTLQRSWGPDALTDQQIGGVVMWGVGDLVLLLAVPALVTAWMRADIARSERRDARLIAAQARSLAGSHRGDRSR